MNNGDRDKAYYLLFDFDGTIADSFKLGLAIINELSFKYGYTTVSEEELNEMKGLPVFAILKRLHLPFYKIPFFAHEVKISLNAKLGELCPIAGIPEVLQKLKSNNIPMALLTSNSIDNVIPFLDKFEMNVFNWFDCDVGLFNKSRHIHKQIIKRKLMDYNCIYIGDEVRDIKAARECNIPVISVSWGFQSKLQLSKYNPDYLIDTPVELQKLFISS